MKSQAKTELQTFPITQKTLAELEVIALNHPFDLSSLSYSSTQKILTIYALKELFKDYGIDLPFHLELPNVPK